MRSLLRQFDAFSGRGFLRQAMACLTLFALVGCEAALPTAPLHDSSVRSAEMASLGRARVAEPGDHGRSGALRLEDIEMEIVQYRPGTGDLYDLNQAMQLLDHPGNALRREASFAGEMSFSDQEGACCVVYPQYSLWEDYVPIPGTGRPDPEQFVVRFRGQLIIPPMMRGPDSDDRHERAVQSLTLAVGSDDGFRLRITNPCRRHRHADGPAEWTAEYDAPRGIAVGPLLPITVPAEGGRFPFELVFFERGGGAILQVGAATGIQASFSASQFRLLEAVSEEPEDDDDAEKVAIAR
jgi:hypothetical protein